MSESLRAATRNLKNFLPDLRSRTRAPRDLNIP
jgi:hypothetical protein